MNNFFSVNANKYNDKYDFVVAKPASLNNPKDNSVMFVTEGHIGEADALTKVKNCIIYWPISKENCLIDQKSNLVIKEKDPHLAFCKFFEENRIDNYPIIKQYSCVGGAYIAQGAIIGNYATIFPGVVIDDSVIIGEKVLLAAGVKITGNVKIGNNVIIRENSVIGADGLTTDRDINGKRVSMPQFGGVIIEDDVEIGANTVIARGAIDNTIIRRGSKIDNCCFISHNVEVGEDTFIVGETIMFGSSSTGKQVYISGNSTIRNAIHLGDKSTVGMGSVVTKSVKEGTTVLGVPAKEKVG